MDQGYPETEDSLSFKNGGEGRIPAHQFSQNSIADDGQVLISKDIMSSGPAADRDILSNGKIRYIGAKRPKLWYELWHVNNYIMAIIKFWAKRGSLTDSVRSWN